MTDILVLANETIGGKSLLDTVLRRRTRRAATCASTSSCRRPGRATATSIYDEVVRDSAQVRVDLALAFMRDEGIEGTGEVGDARPVQRRHGRDRATHTIDEILVSTLPATSSGWLRRDLIERLAGGHRPAGRARGGRPRSRGPALRRDARGRQPDGGRAELVERLKALADEGPRRFIVVVPQERRAGPRGARGAAAARAAAGLARRRGDRRRRHDRRPRPLHGGR